MKLRVFCYKFCDYSREDLVLSNTLWKCRTTSGSELSTMALNTQHSADVQSTWPCCSTADVQNSPTMDWVISLLLLFQFSGSSVKSSWIAEGPAGVIRHLGDQLVLIQLPFCCVWVMADWIWRMQHCFKWRLMARTGLAGSPRRDRANDSL